MRRKLAGAFLTVAFVLAAPVAAYAHDCANASRPAADGFTEKGKWLFIPGPDVWVFDIPANFHNGTEHALLGGTGACGNENRQATRGIQNRTC